MKKRYIAGGVLTLLVIGGIAGSEGTDSAPEAKPKPTATAGKADSEPKGDDLLRQREKERDEAAAKDGNVVFKVWGNAPGGVDITYGSDTDSRDGKWAAGNFSEELKVDDEAMYYSVTAQLGGSGDINCSVTIDGKTKKGHAQGEYNICMAQLNAGLFGGFEK